MNNQAKCDIFVRNRLKECESLSDIWYFCPCFIVLFGVNDLKYEG